MGWSLCLSFLAVTCCRHLLPHDGSGFMTTEMKTVTQCLSECSLLQALLCCMGPTLVFRDIFLFSIHTQIQSSDPVSSLLLVPSLKEWSKNICSNSSSALKLSQETEEKRNMRLASVWNIAATLETSSSFQGPAYM